MLAMAAKLPAFVLACALGLANVAPAVGQTTPDPLRYTLSFPAPHTHYMDVSVSVPTAGRPQVELMMAVWTPGSYLVREFERHVESVTASGPSGQALAVDKSEKNRWRIATGGAPAITVRYRVYSREMGVRTNWVEAGFALVNGAPTFLTLADSPPRPHEVEIVPPREWRRSMTGLPEMSGAAHRYRAPDFDTLVDSPILVGNPAVYEFVVDGKRHFLVNEGEDGVFDGARAAKDLEMVVREHRRMWGSLPYDKYLFLNVITEAAGGLEHKNSTVMMTSRWTTRTRRAYLAWLETASHEFFHTWNVKRLRPVELGPFDYETEVLTRSLWLAEGFTDYYGALALHRAGLTTRDEFLDGLSNEIESLQSTPGRLVQSAELSSLDAWIRFYRPDENTANSSVNYYTKGALIAFLLDARIRRASNGDRNLDDVMRAAYGKYSGGAGYTLEQFRTVAEQTAGVSLEALWHQAVETTAELDYSEALETFGLRFRPAPQGQARAWLGLTTRNDAGRLVVTRVQRDTPAQAAGINVDDEVLAIDEFRVRPDRFENRLEQYAPGDTVSMLVARRDELMRLDVTLAGEPPRAWRLEVQSSPTIAQQMQLKSWLQPQDR
jgi:predicted metalloprotease with PDZ domain